ncbi:XRCC4-like factor-domain-containing protein [Aspergillus ambiguus]|uniref:uncharacterized protein n=1 Tax=Aspergillus ambiguus TaxID=176160 RepID=UPI003CCD4AB4
MTLFMMSAPWKKLHLPETAGLPPLLFKYITTSTSYEVYLTDLTNVWSEHMNRQAILKRADKHDATIDPSEDPDQFGLLLQKIGDALRHEPGSRIGLHQGSSGSLELDVSIKLPAPLEPLKWTLYLDKEQSSSTTAHLLLPLIEAEVNRELRQKTLIDQLNRKDWILAKLFDKIEATGIDLSTIFPGISGLRSGRKGTTLAQAAKYIKGVAPFDEQAWLDEVSKTSPDVDLASNILAEISSSEDTKPAGKLRPPPDAWWEGVSVTEDAIPRSTPKQQKENQVPGPKAFTDDAEMETDSEAETEDDEFQRQVTPPRLKRPQGTERKSPISPEEPREPDEESNKESPPPTRKKMQPKPSKGLGVIGGRKKHHEAPQTPTPLSEHSSPEVEPTQPHNQNKVLTDEDETDSGPDEQDDSSPLSPAASKSEEPPKRLLVEPRGLGVIGGKKKEAKPAPKSPAREPAREPSTEKSPMPAARTKRAGKLGVIGGKTPKSTSEVVSRQKESPPEQVEEEINIGEAKKTKPEPAKSSYPEKAAQKMQPEEPKTEETEQERADRRREELKRQLEAKAKAPAKKKRKF